MVPPGSVQEALAALGDVERRMEALEVRRVRLIGAAQQLGASWEDIGSMLGVSRQAAWERYRDQVQRVLDAIADGAALPEDEILASAAEVLEEVRARRRRG